MKKRNRIMLVFLLGVLLLINLIFLVSLFSKEEITGKVILLGNDFEEEDKFLEVAGIEELSSLSDISEDKDFDSLGGGGGGGSSDGDSSGGGGGSSDGDSSGGGGGSSDGDSSGDGEDEEESLNSIYILPSLININVNEEVKIQIKINSEEDVYAINFELVFDEDILTILEIEEGDFLKNDGAETFKVIDFNNENGKIKFAITRIGTQEGVSGEGVVANIVLKGISKGETILEFQNVKIIDSKLDLIKTEAVNKNLIVD